MSSMRIVLRRAGIKQRRWIRDHIALQRRSLRRSLVHVAGGQSRPAWLSRSAAWDDVLLYDVRIPRSLRPYFEEWQRRNNEARELVFRELRERLSP